MYEFGTLRPPTPVEMERRRVPLETLRVWWVHAYGQTMADTPTMGCAEQCKAEPSIDQLAEFMKQHVIPTGARLRRAFFGCVLDWSHLVLCAVCRQWTEPHGEDDPFHMIMLRAEQARKQQEAETSGFCQLCDRKVVDMDAHQKTPWHRDGVQASKRRR